MGGGSGGSGSGGRSGGGGGRDGSESIDLSGTGGMQVSGKADFTKPVKIIITGKTFDTKTALKDEGFKFNVGDKSWSKIMTGTKMDVKDTIYQAGRWKGNAKKLQANISNV